MYDASCLFSLEADYLLVQKNCFFFFMTLDGYPVGIMEKKFTQHFGKWNTQRRFSSSMFMFGESITYTFDNHRQSIYEGR